MTRIPTLPPQAPRTGSRFTRWLGLLWSDGTEPTLRRYLA